MKAAMMKTVAAIAVMGAQLAHPSAQAADNNAAAFDKLLDTLRQTPAHKPPVHHTLGEWFAARGTIVCPSFFSMKDAEGAADSHNQKWFAETGCAVLQTDSPLTILQDRMSGGTEPVRVRIQNIDATVYIRQFQILGWASDGAGPMPYDDAYHHSSKVGHY